MKHIIFDMDGVLIDTEPEYRARSKRFMSHLGLEVSDEVYNLTCGSNLPDSYQTFRKYVKGFELSYEEYREQKQAYYKTEPIDIKRIVDREVYPLFRYLKEEGYHIALASSTPKFRILSYLEQLELTDYFELIVSGMDFEHSKPDPAIYNYTIRELGTTADCCLVVEDSTYGIAAAKAAGAIVIGKRDDRFGYDQTKADYLVEHLGQVREICERLKEN